VAMRELRGVSLVSAAADGHNDAIANADTAAALRRRVAIRAQYKSGPLAARPFATRLFSSQSQLRSVTSEIHSSHRELTRHAIAGPRKEDHTPAVAEHR
jgi:hypothetical protein